MSFPNFCRLCLQKILGPCKLLNEDPRAINMVKHIFPGMNTSLVETSTICSECFKYIQFSYTMRETVFKNEQKVNSNLAYIRTVEKNTCRLCLNTEISEGTMFLYKTNNQTMSFLEVRSIIEIAILGMPYDIFKKPVVCNSCWQIVRLIYLFKKKCFATEKILKFFCAKNNLKSLTNKEIESVSVCFNANLKKFTRGEKLDLITNLIPRESIENAPRIISESVLNFIKPVDVYLNNFNDDDEYDVFDDEEDDIFIETPIVVKKEASDRASVTVKEEIEVSETLIDSVKGAREKRSTILSETSKSIDEMSEAVSKVKKEHSESLNTGAKDTNNLQTDTSNTQKSEVDDKNSEDILKDSATSEVKKEGPNDLGITSRDNCNDSAICQENEVGENNCVVVLREASSKDNDVIQNDPKITKENEASYKNSKRVLRELASSNVKKEGSNSLEKRLVIGPVQSDVRNSHENEVSDKNSNGVLKEGQISNQKSVKVSSVENKKKIAKNFEYSMVVSVLNQNNSNISQEKECVTEENNEIIENRCSASKQLVSFDENLNNNDKKNPKRIVILENTNKSKELNNDNCNKKAGNHGETMKPVTRKRRLKELKNVKELSNVKNYSDESIKEKLEPIAKKRKNGKGNDKEFEENKDSEKTDKPVFKEIKSKCSDEVLWSCSQCEFTTKYKNHLNRHILTHDKNAVMSCPKCFYTTNIQRNLSRHMLKHDSENFLQCVSCTYSTMYKFNLQQHMLTHDANDSLKVADPKDFRCEECPFVTSKEGQMISHLRAHRSQEKVFKCMKCHYITTRNHSYKNHMELHGKNDAQRKFKCKLCSFEGKRYTHLVSHMLSHDKQGKFCCSQCDYKAKRKSHLITHLLLHQSDDKKIIFQCPLCKYNSVRKEHLKVHCRNVHNLNEVNYNKAQVLVKRYNGCRKEKEKDNCPYCSYTGRSPNLQIHVFTVHFPSNSERMHCNHCSYKTEKRKNLLEHMRAHRQHSKKKDK